MEENTEIHISEEENRQKRRETASWLMEIIRHLYIAADALDGDTVKVTEQFWKAEGNVMLKLISVMPIIICCLKIL